MASKKQQQKASKGAKTKDASPHRATYRARLSTNVVRRNKRHIRALERLIRKKAMQLAPLVDVDSEAMRVVKHKHNEPLIASIERMEAEILRAKGAMARKIDRALTGRMHPAGRKA